MRTRFRSRAAWAAWAALAAAGMVAASPAPAVQSSAAADVLRVETRLVQIDVVVRDREGAVDDLEAGDFTVFDNGRQQEIALFGVNRRSETPPGPTLPEGSISNRADWRGATPMSATAVLVDLLNTDWVSQAWAKNQVRRYVEEHDRDSPLAVYVLGGGLRVVQDYTDNPDRLMAAVTGVEPSWSTSLENSTGGGLTGGFGAMPGQVGLDPLLADAGAGRALDPSSYFLREIARDSMRDRITRTVDALEAIALNLAGLPGRKSLIWIAGGFPFSFEGYSDFDRQMVQRDTLTRMGRAALVLNDADVAVYPIDARGVEGWPSGTETMQSVAEITGGRAYYATNGIAEAIAEAVEDARLTYTLGFYPTVDESDTDFHELRVEVARSGVEVRHRSGYFGFGAFPSLEESGRTVPLADLVRSPVTATSIGLTSRQVDTSSPGGTLTALAAISIGETARRDARAGSPPVYVVRAEVGGLELGIDGESRIGSLDIVLSLLEAGESTARVSYFEDLPVRLSEDEYVQALGEGLAVAIHDHSGREPGWLYVVVRDRTSGAAGSIWVPVDAAGPG